MTPDERRATTARLLASLGVDLRDSGFNSRIIKQKLVQILQIAGSGTPYHFKWYRHGPYSQSLAADLRQIDGHARGNDFPSLRSIRTSDGPVLSRVVDLLRDIPGAPPTTSARTMELYGSLLHLSKEFEGPALLEEFAQRKPKYKGPEVEDAVQRLIRLHWIEG